MTVNNSSAVPLPGVRAISGDTGELWRGTAFQADVIAIDGTIRQTRRPVRMPGTRSVSQKRGEVEREGSFRYQKVDDARELEFLAQVSLSLAEQRLLRDEVLATNPNADPLYAGFSLTIVLDDPQSWGASRMTLLGVQMWEMPIGFNLEELITREIPITWESEQLPDAITRPTV